VSPEEEIDLTLHPMEETETQAQRHQLHYQRTAEENTLKTAIRNFIFSRKNQSMFLLAFPLSFQEARGHCHTT